MISGDRKKTILSAIMRHIYLSVCGREFCCFPKAAAARCSNSGDYDLPVICYFSALMLASLTTRPHLAISTAMNLLNSAGAK